MKWCSLSTLVGTVSEQHENRHAPGDLGKTPPRSHCFLSLLTVFTHVFPP